MEDYFCIPKNVKSARLYIEYLGKKFINEEIKISFVCEDYDLYESSSIEDYGKRFGVTIIPSILFRTKEDIDIISFNPGKSSLSVLEKVKEEKAYRMINILYRLSDKFSIHISPKQIVEKIGKDDMSYIYLARDEDIIDSIVDGGYCDNFKEAYSNFFSRVYLPRLLLPYAPLIKKLHDENEKELYIVNPNNYIKNTKTEGELGWLIKGFVFNYKEINADVKDICLRNNLSLRFGSGKFIE